MIGLIKNDPVDDLEVIMNRGLRALFLLTLLVLAMSAFAPVASAFDGRSGDQVVIGKDEVVNDDLFARATTVVVDGTVNGDLITGGQTVTINGKVTGNVIAAGTSVTVNGTVGHDVIALGAAVTLGPDARVAHNVYAGGASVESKPGSRIDGSLLMGAGQGLVSGQTANDLLAGTARLRLEGTVARNVKIAVDSASRSSSPGYFFTGPRAPAMPTVPVGLTFGPDAHVGGALEYVSSDTVDIAPSVTTQVTHTLPPQDQQLSRELAQRQTTSSYIFDAVRHLVALLLVGILIAWLAPRWITGPANRLLSKPLPSLGVGLVGLVAAPITWLVALGVIVLIAVVFGLLSLGGLTALTLLAGLPALGLAAFALLFIVGYLCQAIVGYLGGRLLLSSLRPEWNRTIYGPLLTGVLILGVLFAVPYAGGLLQFLVVLAGLGAIALVILQRRGAYRPPADFPISGQA